MSRYLKESYAKYITEQARHNSFRTTVVLNEDIKGMQYAQGNLDSARKKMNDMGITSGVLHDHLSKAEETHTKIYNKDGSSDASIATKDAHTENAFKISNAVGKIYNQHQQYMDSPAGPTEVDRTRADNAKSQALRDKAKG
jgi:hypothetical protein